MTKKTAKKSEILKFFVPPFLLVLVIWGSLFVLKSTLEKNTSPIDLPSGLKITEGTVLPEFDLSDENLKPIPFSKRASKVNLINFWATWCTACMIEIPSMIRLQSQFPKNQFEIFAVSVDEKPEVTFPLLKKEFELNFSLWIDAGQKLSNFFDIHAIPYSIIIDQNRKILMIEYGDRQWDAPEVVQKIKDWTK